MSFENSEVMEEFFKIMAAQEAPAKNPHQEDKRVIEEKREFPEEDLIEEAHPEKVYVAESRGDGGLVENQNEQHEKIMSIVNKMPTGALLGTYASTVDSLVKMANACDEIGDKETADKLTDVAKKVLALMENCPFDIGTCIQDGEISPLSKNAGPGQLALKGLKFFTEDFLRPLWAVVTKGAEIDWDVFLARWLGKEAKQQTGQFILENIEKVFVNTNEASISAATGVANKLKGHLGNIGKQLDNLNHLITMKKAPSMQTDLQLVAGLKKELESALTELGDASSNTAAGADLQKHIEEVLSNPSLNSYVPAGGGGYSPAHIAKQELTELIGIKQQIANSTSPYFNDPNKFLRQWIELKTNPEKLGVWMLNPENAKQINYLVNNPMRRASLQKLLSEGKISWLKGQALNMALSNTAKVVGVSAQSLVVIGGVYAFAKWLASDNSANTIQRAQNTEEALGQISATGYGKQQLDAATDAINKIVADEQQIDTLKANLITDENNPQSAESIKEFQTSGRAEKVVQYIARICNNLKSLQQSLDQWEEVVESTENKDSANKAAQQIKDFLVQRNQAYAKLNADCQNPHEHLPEGTPAQAEPQAEPQADDNLVKTQTRKLYKIRVYGAEQDIANLIETTIAKIKKEEFDIDKKAKDPQAIKTYLTESGKDLKVLIDSINTLNIAKIDNKTQQVVAQAVEFITPRIPAFNKNAPLVGLSVLSMPKIPQFVRQPSAPQKDDNIIKIQSFLKVQQTGTLDKDTIQALQTLEKTYNQVSQDTVFTGAFINPGTKYVISADNLEEAGRRIAKYY